VHDGRRFRRRKVLACPGERLARHRVHARGLAPRHLLQPCLGGGPACCVSWQQLAQPTCVDAMDCGCDLGHKLPRMDPRHAARAQAGRGPMHELADQHESAGLIDDRNRAGHTEGEPQPRQPRQERPLAPHAVVQVPRRVTPWNQRRPVTPLVPAPDLKPDLRRKDVPGESLADFLHRSRCPAPPRRPQSSTPRAPWPLWRAPSPCVRRSTVMPRETPAPSIHWGRPRQ
jgi:hypothetical protein